MFVYTLKTIPKYDITFWRGQGITAELHLLSISSSFNVSYFQIKIKKIQFHYLKARVSVSAQSAPRTQSCLPWAMIGLVLRWVLQSCNPCKLSRVAVLQNHKVTTATRPKSQFMRDGWHLFIAKSHVYKCYCRTSTPWLCHKWPKRKSSSNTHVPLTLCNQLLS